MERVVDLEINTSLFPYDREHFLLCPRTAETIQFQESGTVGPFETMSLAQYGFHAKSRSNKSL